MNVQKFKEHDWKICVLEYLYILISTTVYIQLQAGCK
jgi:hypothetical protein